MRVLRGALKGALATGCWLALMVGTAPAASVVVPFFAGAKVAGDAGANHVALSAVAGPASSTPIFTIQEPGISTQGFQPGSACQDVGDAVTCRFDAEPPVSDAPSITVESGDGDDAITSGTFATVFTGNGNDTVLDGSADNSILGGAGNDMLVGGGGRDFINGGSGADQLLGGAGIDSLVARDRQRDQLISCGPGNNRKERARTDRIDPTARSC